MRPEILQILDGNFVYETGNIDFSCSRLEIELEESQIYEGEFSVYGSLEGALYGKVTTSDYRMVCQNPDFDERGAVIHFSYDASYMKPGDVEKGFFYVVSNQGEGYLSYVVSMVHKVPNSSMGSIRNLFHFTNLAQNRWDEALSLFYKKEFEDILTGVDSKYYEAYKSLSVQKGNEQNMEEFLLHINKKQPIMFETVKTYLEFETTESIIGSEIEIRKNGWGYTFLKVETEGDFLSVEHSFLTEENFLGNRCQFLFYIHPEGLHQGKNYGKLLFSNSFVSLEVTILVNQKDTKNHNNREYRERQRCMISLMEYYQSFRLKQINGSVWLKETSHLVDKMLLNNETDTAARLFQAQLLITESRFEEARWVLDKAEEMFVKEGKYDRSLYAYYLYLTSLENREESYVNKVTTAIIKMFRETPNDWYIGWLLLFLSEEISSNSLAKWDFLEEQFYKGANSPLFYIEAFLMLSAAPNMLSKLDEFEVQVLMYGAKKRLISKDLMRQFLYLLEKNKGFDNLLYKMLVILYEMYEDDNVLYHICSMLIKSNMTDEQYFRWYALAVEKNLKITRLYEFYMLAVDKKQLVLLPRIILLYFNYNSNLDEKTNAYLYACIYRFSDKIGELWNNYRPQIERFVIEQVIKENIDKNLAFLYKNVLCERMINEEVANHMAKILFAHCISIDKNDCCKKNLRYVVIKSKETMREEIYPIKNSQAIVFLYNTEHTICFEDAYKNRYIKSVGYVTEKLLLPAKMAKMIAPFVTDCIGFDEFICASYKDIDSADVELEERYIRLMNADYFMDIYRQKIRMYFIQYYYEKERLEDMDALLDTIEGDRLDTEMKKKVISHFIMRGMNERAYNFMKEYGVDNIDGKLLFRLVRWKIEDGMMEKDERLLHLSYSCFKMGKYDSLILQYLVYHFEGLSKDMRDIWQACQTFGVEAGELCQRCLEQILCTGAYISDLQDMYISYTHYFVEPELEHALFAQWSYDYLIKDKLVSGYMFAQMLQKSVQYEYLLVEKLALIKYYAENKLEITEQNMDRLKLYIREMLGDKILFPYFLQYIDEVPELKMYADKTFVEYKGAPDGKVTLHYMIELGNGEGSEYCTEELRNIYGGLYCKEFLLFYGETLQYYIMEEQDGKEQLTESGTLGKEEVPVSEEESRYNMLNDIAISATMQDYETLETMLEEYYKKTYIVDSLFEESETV